MTRDEAVVEVQRGLGFRTDRAAEIVLELKAAQRKYEQGGTLPWIMRDVLIDSVLAVGGFTISLPTNFVKLTEEDWAVSYTTSDSTESFELRPYDLRELKRLWPFNTAVSARGRIQGYGLYSFQGGNYLLFRPTPDRAYTLTVYYYARQTPLDLNIENNWLKYYPDVLIGEAGLKFAEAEGDAAAQQKFTRQKDDAVTRMLADTISREAVQVPYTLGSNF